MGWFRGVQSEFSCNLMPYAGHPIRYVEIGCWRGESAAWVAEHVLTHPGSRGYGIDPYAAHSKHSAHKMLEVRGRAIERLRPYPNWNWRFEDSKVALRSWRESIDVLYIDGLHSSQMVLQDFCLAFPHLRDGSLVIFDDFGIGMRGLWRKVSSRKKRLRKRTPCVPEAVAAVLIAFQGHVIPCPGNDRQFAMRIDCHPGSDKGDSGLERWYRVMAHQRHMMLMHEIFQQYGIEYGTQDA